jgi:hypothetical protein
VRELVGNAVPLQIGNVVAGKVNAPFLEIPSDNSGVVVIVSGIARDCGTSQQRHE